MEKSKVYFTKEISEQKEEEIELELAKIVEETDKISYLYRRIISTNNEHYGAKAK